MYDHLFVIFFIMDPSSYYSHLWQARYCSQFWTWWVSNCNIWHVSNCPSFLTSYFQSFSFFPSLPKAKTFPFSYFLLFLHSHRAHDNTFDSRTESAVNIWLVDCPTQLTLTYDLDLSVVFCTKIGQNLLKTATSAGRQTHL